MPLGTVRPVQTISGNSFMTQSLPEAATQTFKKGELVYLTGGYVTETGDNPGTILGFAAEDGSNLAASGDGEVAVWVANADTIFEGTLADSAGVAAATAATDIGQAGGLVRDTTNSRVYPYVAGGNPRVQLVEHSKKDALAVSAGRIHFMVLGPFRQLDTTS